MTMSPHHAFSRAVIRFPSSLGTKGAEVPVMFRLLLQPPHPCFPPASALACTFCLAKVKTEPINIQAVLSTKLIGSSLKSADIQYKVKHCQSPCWWRSPSFGKSRDKSRSVGWIPHKYQRAFANFQFLFRAKRRLLRFFVSDCEDGEDSSDAGHFEPLDQHSDYKRGNGRKLQAAHEMEAGARGQIKKKTGLWGLSQMTGRGLRGSGQFNFFFQFTNCSHSLPNSPFCKTPQTKQKQAPLYLYLVQNNQVSWIWSFLSSFFPQNFKSWQKEGFEKIAVF